MRAGKKVKIGGKVHTIPPLREDEKRRLSKALSVVRNNEEGYTEAAYFAAREIIHTAIRQNYPFITLDDLDDMLDGKSIVPAYLAALGMESVPWQ